MKGYEERMIELGGLYLACWLSKPMIAMLHNGSTEIETRLEKVMRRLKR
jgi:hypothetical protein